MIEWMTFDPKTLHEIERKIIKALSHGSLTEEELTEKTGLNVDQVRRGVQWLEHKKFVVPVTSKENESLGLGERGKKTKGILPGRFLVQSITDSVSSKSITDSFPPGATFVTIKEGQNRFEEAKKKSGFDFDWNSSVANARDMGLATIEGDKLKITDKPESQPEKLLKKIAEEKTPILYDQSIAEKLPVEERSTLDVLIKQNYLERKSHATPTTALSASGHKILDDVTKLSETERTLDVTAPSPIIYAGRKHPLQDIVDEVREIFVGLGFEEIDGPMVQNGFWNFDVLFTPQDHPAREMQDTFYIASLRAGSVADKKIVNNVASIHKKGWGYNWRIDYARRLVLRTHTTPVTIRYLADKKPEQASVFSVGRVFRNEKLTYKHLAEFYQVEGIVVGKDVTLRDLMGLQTEFYSKMGLKKVKFWPSFFPYTEPSLQSMVYHEKLGKWVELFGMGIFRPEVTLPIGVENPVLAWGGGLERIAMLRYGLDDVRELYSNKLGWLRSVPKCQ